MSWLLDALTREYERLDAQGGTTGLLEPHLDEHDGQVYITPSIIENGDRKEDE